MPLLKIAVKSVFINVDYVDFNFILTVIPLKCKIQ